MVQRDDVMRSDRLKQVMQEIDPNFDEKGIGFSKFSKFLSEAASRGLLELIKVGNGQYEVGPAKGGATRSSGGGGGSSSRGRRGRGGRGGGRASPAAEPQPEAPAVSAPDTSPTSDDPLQDAYAVLRSALERLREAGREPARDSDVKRKILEQRPDFDEAELGFAKFSKFLAQAEEHGVVHLDRGEAGNLDVSLPGGSPRPTAHVGREEPTEAEQAEERQSRDEEPTEPAPSRHEPEPTRAAGPTVIDVLPIEPEESGLRLGPRRGSTRRRGEGDVVPFFEGQVAGTRVATQAPPAEQPVHRPSEGPPSDIDGLGLPIEPDAILRYLTHRYRGVGEKTAETLVEHFGAGLFKTLAEDPEAIGRVIPANRAEQVLEAWKADYERRTGGGGAGSGGDGGDRDGNRRRGRGRSRGRPRG
jgi:hypothetical protein